MLKRSKCRLNIKVKTLMMIDNGGTQRLPQLVGKGRALDMIMTLSQDLELY